MLPSEYVARIYRKDVFELKSFQNLELPNRETVKPKPTKAEYILALCQNYHKVVMTKTKNGGL